ncbi:MAG: 4'-phosphopantetheinyl transferase family protein [Actinomycetota bacterium]
MLVWKAWLDGPDAHRRLRTLSLEERTKAAGFVFDRHRNRYIQCRSAVRELLARYLEIAPGEVVFDCGPFDKPEVRSPGLALRFNVSHCEEWALIALTLEDRLGVDLEAHRGIEDLDDLAGTCFSEAELEVYFAVRPDQKVQTFFNCWTRKEAFVKACGEGLSHPLKDFDVTLAPGDPALLKEIRGERDRARDWTLIDLKPMPGFAGAIAVEHAAASVKVVGWTGDQPPETRTRQANSPGKPETTTFWGGP